MKLCKRCGQTKELSDFAIHKQSKDGRSCWCKRCNADAARERRLRDIETYKARDRQKYAQIMEHKRRPCQDCGLTFPSCCMDFDHVRGEKRFQLSRSTGRSWEDILEEINKCDIVCANCHRIRTYIRAQYDPKNAMPKAKSRCRLGMIRSAESRQNMSEAQKIIWQNPEHRKRMSETHIGQVAWNKGMSLGEA